MPTNHDIPVANKAKQASALLAALMEHGPMTTDDSRTYLNVMHPAGRVRELRARGHNIETRMGWFPDSDGKLHRMAQYVLHPENGHAA